MLSVETIAKIRRDHFRDGKSIKAIARTRGVSRNMRRLHAGELCGQFPGPALDFLAAVIGEDTQWLPDDLLPCLEAIRRAEEDLANDARYERLMDLLRQRGKL